MAEAHKKASDHKAVKSLITILFCSNASGDHIIKPLIINLSKSPHLFKRINTVTATIFNEWFHS